MKNKYQLIYNFDSRNEFEIASRAVDWALVAWDLDAWLREQLKYKPGISKEEVKVYAKVREELQGILKSRKLTLDMIE